ncbi:MAG: NAD(P)H-hydrate dehydratase [Ruminococcaceae bacterium]|nr:NAD(P)H-hydrate dehydratase [Oscillospiraceae bacterium]
MKRVVSTRVMRFEDAETIRRGTSGRELMQRAATRIFESYAWQGPVAVVCGSGNNAGDGYALAVLLHGAKIACTVYSLSDSFSEEGAYYYGKCKEIGVKIADFTEKTDFSDCTEIVDCIFGTGFRGLADGIFAQAIKRINQSGKIVISVDINSGLNGDTGLSPLCVKSNVTLSIGSLKQGLLLNQAKDCVGLLQNLDIGIGHFGECVSLCESKDFSHIFAPRREDSHKGNYGYVSILGGCREYAGAVKLANLSCSALRAGCGVAQLILPESIAPSVAPYLLESTLAVLPDHDGHILFDADRLDALLARQAALAIGMGWGRSPENAKILQHVLQNYDIPLVIDADGLNTLSEMDSEIVKRSACRVVLTPHLKEMERLSGVPIASLREDPIGRAEALARQWGVIVLLKGACTVITDGKDTYLVNRGCAGMATAGSGDVLSGILVGLLGYAPCDPLTVACGAYVAGLAGELAARDVNTISMLASDTVAHVPSAISKMMGK